MKGEVASEPVYRALRRAILSGELRGGAPLFQDEIASRHGVSKIPVREALRRLEMEGLVEFRARRGAIVRPISPKEILQLIDVRLALECRALKLAIPNFADSDLKIAGEIHEEYKVEPEPERWSELNLRFHHALIDPCGNDRLLLILETIEQRMGSLMRLRVTEASGLERPIFEHGKILDACLKRDATAATAALGGHIETTQKEVAAHFRRKAMRRSGASV